MHLHGLRTAGAHGAALQRTTLIFAQAAPHAVILIGVQCALQACVNHFAGAAHGLGLLNLLIGCTGVAHREEEFRIDLPVVGSIQFDAAWSPTVAATKAKGNDVAGHVNVFVFPDLCAGNIGYKAVQRSSGALAIGPVLQGLNKPVNDLSRGALVQDIINTIALTAIEAQ